MPPAGDILDVLYERRANFSRLVGFLKAINFTGAFQMDDHVVTFFAPTNQASAHCFHTTHTVAQPGRGHAPPEIGFTRKFLAAPLS